MKKRFLQFQDARRIIVEEAKRLGITGYNDWQQKYIKSSNFPLNIPKQPQITYRGNGWISWGHWLGTDSVSNIQRNRSFLHYQDAKKKIQPYIKLHGITSKRKWYKHSGLIPDGVPSCPNRTYKNKGWVSWADWLGTNNVSGGFNCRKYHVDEDFFRTWTDDMAYVAGFWWADGCMKDHRRFDICQHKRDRYLLENIGHSMSSNYPVRESKRGCCYLEISSEKLCEGLRCIGGICNKSKTIGFPCVPNKFMRDFIRGIFDGDGCITYDCCSRKYMSYISSSSKQVQRGIVNGLKGFGIHASLSSSIHVKFNAKNTLLLGNFMYYHSMNTSLMMKRKYDKFCLAGSNITGLGIMV